jgi:hypothetical protein
MKETVLDRCIREIRSLRVTLKLDKDVPDDQVILLAAQEIEDLRAQLYIESSRPRSD